MNSINIWFTDFWENYNFNFIFKILENAKINFLVNKENPDILFYSCFGKEHKKYNCLKIFYTGETQLDDDDADYVIGFKPSDNKRYIQLRNFERLYFELCNNYKVYSSIKGNSLPIKDKFCCFIVSNPNCWQRNYMFETLSKYKFVHSLGKFKNNSKIKITDRNTPEFFNTISQFKFSICFENQSKKHYLTEKIYDVLKSTTIPIYWGDPDVIKVFNPQSFIYVESKENYDDQIKIFELIIEKIIKIDQDDNLYYNILQQKPVIDPYKEDSRVLSSLDQISNILLI